MLEAVYFFLLEVGNPILVSVWSALPVWMRCRTRWMNLVPWTPRNYFIFFFSWNFSSGSVLFTGKAFVSWITEFSRQKILFGDFTSWRQCFPVKKMVHPIKNKKKPDLSHFIPISRSGLRSSSFIHFFLGRGGRGGGILMPMTSISVDRFGNWCFRKRRPKANFLK